MKKLIFLLTLLAGCIEQAPLDDVADKDLIIIKLEGEVQKLELENKILKENYDITQENIESLRSNEDKIISKIKDELGTYEAQSPKDRLDLNDLEIRKDKVILKVDNPTLSKFTDTNSMDPVLDKEANAIMIKPKSALDISEGDIISFTVNNGRITHRVVGVGNDGETYYVTKGDNNAVKDPYKIRFNQVNGIVIGIIY